MTDQTPTLEHTSVVLVSPSPIDTQSIRPEALTYAQIVPLDWVLTNRLSTPVLALAQYQNGVSIRAEGNRCIFQEVIGGPLRQTYEVHRLVRRYLEATKLVPYNAIGINWMLELVVEDPKAWIRKQLGDLQQFPDFSPVSLKIAKPMATGVCNLTFITEQTQRALAVDCNYHFQLSSSLQPMAALDRWKQCQIALTETVIPSLQA